MRSVQVPHGIHTGALCMGILCLSTAALLTIPEMAKGRHVSRVERTAPLTPTSQEVRFNTTKDGKKWAVVKIWEYTFTPVDPKFDVQILNDTLAIEELSIVVVESDDRPKGVWGWIYQKDIEGKWVMSMVTPEIERAFPDIFNPRN